ncbi:hypothetical protein SAMN04487996_12162 [Dyadobacter soli]|uniref:Uncharacterized protein n=1 Tax=Dyadobacter soli TaxID=659014 RepID=A0A1G7VZM5_9BACT|nr:hypothetical protein [Dyadobacter soli]SDG65236.1 hypothetical protein SAMN04487996_12162 [Dyadobacter soli]
MKTNAEKYELATPLIFGTAIGALCSPFGPVVAIIGFAVGAGSGFWFDKVEDAKAESHKKAPVESASKKSICN